MLSEKVENMTVFPTCIMVTFITDQEDGMAGVQVVFNVPGEAVSCCIDYVNQAGEICTALHCAVVKSGCLLKILSKIGQQLMVPLLRQGNGRNNDTDPQPFLNTLQIFDRCACKPGFAGPGHYIYNSPVLILPPGFKAILLPFI